MGRLAVMLGSSALGPGGEEIAAAAAEHGAAIVQRHGGERLRPPTRDRPRRQPAAAGRAGLRPGAGDRLGRLAQRRAAGRQPALPRRLHRPPCRPLDLRRRAAPTGAPRFDPRWRERSARRLGRERPGKPHRRRRLLADDRAALRDPGRDPPDGRPRRRGRDDDRLRVHRRRRARARLRGDLRRRQPRQRHRRRSRSRSPSWKRPGQSTRLQLRDGLAAVLPRLGAVGR